MPPMTTVASWTWRRSTEAVDALRTWVPEYTARGPLGDISRARKLFIGEATVHSHVLNIYTKIGVNSRAGAALFAMENDLVHA